MAGPMMCDTGDETPGFLSISNMTNGEVQYLCAPCVIDFCWGMVESAPDYDAQMQKRMIALAEAAQAERPAAKRRPRKAAEGAEETGKDSVGTADAESTAEPE